MPVPKYDAMYPSLLKCLSDREVHTNRQMVDFIAADMGLSPDDQQETLPNGKSVFRDRVSWACTYLKKAGLVESVKRGHHRISDEGLRVLASSPKALDNKFLCQYPSFRQFFERPATTPNRTAEIQELSNETPNDLIHQAISSINQNIADELMTEIMKRDASFSENLVVKLLLKMGYGGSAFDSGFVTQKSNDGGIDGIIREDKLGFDQIYIQAKRWNPEQTVGRPEIQKFSGALQDEGASKGLFITTAKFSDGAKISAEKQHIVLVDGARLTKLMIEYNLGVTTTTVYEIKSIDSDFFSDDSDDLA